MLLDLLKEQLMEVKSVRQLQTDVRLLLDPDVTDKEKKM